MTNNKSIQVLRGNHSNVTKFDKSTLLPGQPLYDLETQELFIGGGQPNQPITAQKCNEYPVTSVNGKTGTITISKSDIGLSNVPNVNCQNASNLTSGIVNKTRLPTTSTSITSNLAGHNSSNYTVDTTWRKSSFGCGYYHYYTYGNFKVNVGSNNRIEVTNIIATDTGEEASNMHAQVSGNTIEYGGELGSPQDLGDSFYVRVKFDYIYGSNLIIRQTTNYSSGQSSYMEFGDGKIKLNGTTFKCPNMIIKV